MIPEKMVLESIWEFAGVLGVVIVILLTYHVAGVLDRRSFREKNGNE